MRRLWTLMFLLLLGGCALRERPVAAPPPSPTPSAHPTKVMKGVQFTLDWSLKNYEGEKRDQYQKPEAVMAALHLQPGQVVADIGAGTGYFTRRLAKAVGPQGRALALDVNPSLVTYVAERARKEGQSNIESRVVPPDDPQLAPNSVDLAFMVNTIFHLRFRDPYYPKIVAGLKPDGRFAVIDCFDKNPPNLGPVKGRVPKKAIVAEIEKAGFKLEQDLDILPTQDFLIFRVHK